MFDHALVSVADSGDIIVKKIVPERIYQLLHTNGKIRLPFNRVSAPHPEFLKFHREVIYNSAKC
jgi:putative restriction endonuclease